MATSTRKLCRSREVVANSQCPSTLLVGHGAVSPLPQFRLHPNSSRAQRLIGRKPKIIRVPIRRINNRTNFSSEVIACS